MNRLTKITEPDGSATSVDYDTRGRRNSVTDANGKTTNYAYENADGLTSVIDAAGNVSMLRALRPRLPSVHYCPIPAGVQATPSDSKA